MFPLIYLTVLMQSYVFSGKEKDVDFLLLKAKSLARAKRCLLCDGDENNGWISCRYEQFFEDGMWMVSRSDISADNHRQMSEGAYDCIVQCFGADENAKWLTGIGSGGARVERLGSAPEHQIGKQDIVLERLTLGSQRDLAPQDRAPILHTFTAISILQADFESARACASRGAPPGTFLAKRLEHWLLTNSRRLQPCSSCCQQDWLAITAADLRQTRPV
jgi:hypothetical protein